MKKRRVIAALAVILALTAVTSAIAQSRGLVFRVPVTGTVEMGLAPFIERSIREAEAAGAEMVILDIDTPGGRVDAAERISDAINDSQVPVYAFVNRRAFSAGALIALSTQRVYMRAGSVMGAVTPVDGQGTKASEKIVSAMRSEMRALAEARGLDPAIAEAMVDESLAVEGVVESGRLLTLTMTEAVDLGYAVEVEDLNALMATLGVAGGEVRDIGVNWAESLVRFLSHPVVAPFLLSLGFLGLIVEVKTPSLGMAGGAGVLALSLFFGSHLILGLAGWEDLLIFGAGVLLVAIEVLVIPGVGLFGFVGLGGIVAGLYMSMLGSLPTMQDLGQAGGVIATTMLILLVTTWALVRHLPKSTRLFRSSVFLAHSTDREEGYQSALVRPELVGRVGQAITDLRPAGLGLFGEERIDVVSDSEWITEGTRVEIIADEGYRHVVRPVTDAEVTAESVDKADA
jgi:membrane-bound serine protease (ClpP class)